MVTTALCSSDNFIMASFNLRCSSARSASRTGLLVAVNSMNVIKAQLKTPAALLKKVQRHVHRDRMNPGIKGRLATEPADRFVGLGKNILQEIVRVLVV